MLATGKATSAAHPTSAAAASRADETSRVGLRADLLAGLLVLLAAVATRLPYLGSVPRFRDETFNALIALRIHRGQEFPLTDIEFYIGAFFNYAVAAGMFVVGPTIYAARQVVTGFGILTVGATYLLGRELGGGGLRGLLVGLVAAAFMTTNGIHIAPMGHVAFSGSITPFFTTLGFWLLHRWSVRRTGSTLVWAGFMLGMSMHTHPTIVAFLPGVLGWYLWRNLGAIRTRWPYLAALAFVVAFAPMIAFNVMTGGQSIRHALYTANERPDYVGNRSAELTPESYLDRQRQYWLMLHGTLGAAVDERDGKAGYLTDPFLVATTLLTIAGLAWAARRYRYTLPLWLLGSFSVILPIFNVNHYDVEYDGRYVVPLLPMFYATIGLLLVDVCQRANRSLSRPPARIGVAAALGALVVVLAADPLVSLSRYYAKGVRAEPTNASMVRTAEEITASLRPGEVVVLDNNLNDRRVEHASPWDEASTFRVLRYIMEFDRVPYEVVDVDPASLAALARRGQSGVVVLSSGFDSKDTARLADLIEQFGLEGLDGEPTRAPRPADRFGLYRFEPSRAAQATERR